jgi:adenylate cyclase
LEKTSAPEKQRGRSREATAAFDSANLSSNRTIARLAAGALALVSAVHLSAAYLISADRSLEPLENAVAMLALAGVLLALVRLRLKPSTATGLLQAVFIAAIPASAAILGGLHDSLTWSAAFVFLIASLVYAKPAFTCVAAAAVVATLAAPALLPVFRPRGAVPADLLAGFALLAIASVSAVLVAGDLSNRLRLGRAEGLRLREELGKSDQRMRMLETYTRKSLVQFVESGRNPAEIVPEMKEMAVMFCDIREFARLSQKMEPHTLIALLNDFYEAMGYVIARRGGEIDKLIGDCILATFPDADSALTAAVEMKEALFDLNDCNIQGGLPRLRTGIGIHFGTLVVGNLGSREKMDLTIIGDTVNVASRIETLTKFYMTDVIVSEDFKNRLSLDMKMRYIDTVRVKGREDPIRLYEVFEHHRSDTVAAKELELGRLDSAFRLYSEGHFSDAISLLLQVGEKAGEHDSLIGFYKDPLINVLLDRCIVLFQRQKTGDLPSWDGIFQFQAK